jgi:CheY-like chemotaxis protein
MIENPTVGVVEIHYVDDDIDYLDFFEEAISQINETRGPKLRFYRYTAGDDLIKALLKKTDTLTIAFLDINMPVKTGLDVLQVLKSHSQLQAIPAIMYSTSDDERFVNISRAMGANLYAVKPASINGIKQIILAALYNISHSELPGKFLIKFK